MGCKLHPMSYPTYELTLYVPGFPGSLEEPPDYDEVTRTFDGPRGLIDACRFLEPHWMEYGEANLVCVEHPNGDTEDHEDIAPSTLYAEYEMYY